MPGSPNRSGSPKGTLVNWNNELDAEIAQARSVELKVLQEEFFLLKEGRIRFLGEADGEIPSVYLALKIRVFSSS